MAIQLNAYPISFPQGVNISGRLISYDKDKLRELRVSHDTHAFYRLGDKILCLSPDGNYPIEGEDTKLNEADAFHLLNFLVKDGIIRFLKSQNRNLPIGFNPIEIVSAKPSDNLISGAANGDYPFAIYCKYEIDIRPMRGKPYLTIDCSTKNVVTQPCIYFQGKNFDLIGRYITNFQGDYRKLLGSVIEVSGSTIKYQTRDGEILEAAASEVTIEASRENFDDYAEHIMGKKAQDFLEDVRIKVSTFNGGQNKKDRIEILRTYLADKITTVNGIKVLIGPALDISRYVYQKDKPMFVFNDNGEANWQEKGLNQFGPYTKRTFDRNNSSICVICSQQHKGQLEQFIHKFLKGIPGHKYYAAGLEGKFHTGTSRVEFFTVADDSPASYEQAIEAAIQKKTQENGRWDLALVQVKQSYKSLPVIKNPYYVARSLLLLHQIPVQDFTLELIGQNDTSLGYSMNNMALASYAKMGGVPWLLKSSPTLSHELVIGIGSANLSENRLSSGQRVMGITTVFSGDGSYIVSNTSKAVHPDQYAEALTTVLRSTMEKVRTRMNWQKGDTIRIVFHASVKKFNRDEIEAVKSLMADYREYNIEYAFLKISDHHGLHMFDTATANEPKGKLAPFRGTAYKISEYEILLYLIGNKELKQGSDGHPRGVIVDIHRDSNFKDIKYLSTQLFNFSAHSWRSYFPNPMPVTISYSDLIAQNLGWLNKIPRWNDSIMLGKIGQTQWFL